MEINDRNKGINRNEELQSERDNATNSTSISDQQLQVNEQSNVSSNDANEDGQEGWVAVGSGLGIDE